jgi:hypothetical protein
MNKISTAVGATMLVALSALAVPAFADKGGNNDDQVCDDLSSGKTELSGQDATTEIPVAPTGFLISGYCVKAGSGNQEGGGPVYVDIVDTAGPVTISHPSGKGISHFSYTLVPVPTETQTTTTSTTTTTTTTPSTPETSTSTPVVVDNEEEAPEEEETDVQGESANNAGNNSGGGSNEVLGAQAPAAAPAEAPAAEVPTVVNAGATGETSSVSAPAMLALLGALLGMVAVGMRRNLLRVGGRKA